MNCRASLLAGVLCVATVRISAATRAWIIRFDGTGPVKIGMSLTELNAVLHQKFSLPKDEEEQGCFYVKISKHPGISIMIEDGHVTRIDVERRGIATAEGIRVGDSEARALQVYGPKLKIQPHAYTGPLGHYLTVRSSDGHGIRFETDGNKIVSFYAGTNQAISYIEGCL